MKPRRRRAPASLPVGALMAQVLVVVAVVLIFGAYRQYAQVDQKSADVSAREAQLDRREASLDQRSSGLDDREGALDEQSGSLNEAQAALERDRESLKKAQADLDDQSSNLDALERDLAAREQALKDAQAALDGARSELETSRKAFDDQKAAYDEKLARADDLARAVDGALAARSRVASALSEAVRGAGFVASVDAETGDLSVRLSALFDESQTSLSKAGTRVLDALLPLWLGVLKDENLSALSVEVDAPPSGSPDMSAAARRALAILSYARDGDALTAQSRAALARLGLSGARGQSGSSANAVFRFDLNDDALEAARAG